MTIPEEKKREEILRCFIIISKALDSTLQLDYIAIIMPLSNEMKLGETAFILQM